MPNNEKALSCLGSAAHIIRKQSEKENFLQGIRMEITNAVALWLAPLEKTTNI